MKYDDSSVLSIKEYGELLIDKTFNDVLNLADITPELKCEIINKVNTSGTKGGMGHLIEKYHFEYEINNEQEPDFPKVGMELKVAPFEEKKKGGYKAGERLVITMISYKDPVIPNLYESHVYKKFRLTLFIHYFRNRDLLRTDYPIKYVTLFSPPEEDMKIIKEDYEKITQKIAEGRAHELSEGDTMYLGACTKGATAAKSNVFQEYYAPDVKAKKRAFCFKQSYMTTILNNYVFKKVNTYDSILKSLDATNSEQTFENLIISTINQHVGKTDQQLASEFNLKPGAKNFYSSLAYRMLGIRSNKAAEFIKANIEVKAIRIEDSGKMKESISFPTFEFNEYVKENWEESTFYNILSSKRFLFVVYKKIGNQYVLKGCKLWNMSNEDLNEVEIGWEAIKNVAIEGPIFEKKYKKNGEFEITNNFPKKEDHRIIHIRPHTSNRYYVLEDGEVIGINPNDGDTLPDGRIMTKQSFWLNNSYVIKQIGELI
ncbi:MAG: Sau3AI family type II restriction endonuclease [Solibacillus sp.]